MVADLVHFALSLSIATTQLISLSPFRLVVSSLAKPAQRRVVALSSCPPFSSAARQTARCHVARCRPVAWFISHSFDLSRATM
jgi:hypothetical protein